MSERPRAPIRLTATRVGRTDLGDGSAVLEDDAITVHVRASAERPMRLPHATIDRAVVAGDELQLLLSDGTRITLVSPAAANLHEDLLIRCHAMPEVTRALRAFGSRRGQHSVRSTAASEQQRFFAPLLEARRRAGAAGGPLSIIAAFDAETIAADVSAALTAFTTERHPEPGAARRALEAELVDAAEPLMLALADLGEAATRAGAEIDDLRLWRAWSAQVRATFETADRVWLAIDTVLEGAPPRP